MVKKISYGYSLMVNGQQERRTDAGWTKEDAQNALAARLVGLGQDAPTPDPTGIRFGQAVERYLQAKSRKKSIQDDARHLTMLRGVFGAETPLAAITAATISAWKAERLAAVCARTKRGYAAATINRPLQALRHLLRLVHEEWEVLPAVACRASRNPDLAAIVTMALETGLRKGEFLGITW